MTRRPRPLWLSLFASLWSVSACRTELLVFECDAARPCAPSSDPCRVALCSPSGQCLQQPVSNGIACGELSDCATAHACVAGTCSVVPANDGVECAFGTPCQDPGTCQSGVCVQPKPTPWATPLWEQAPAHSTAWVSRIAADSDGNFTWQECPDIYDCPSSTLVSVDPGGHLRYRVTTASAGSVALAGELLIRTGGCYTDSTGPRDGFLEARSASDGTLQWSLDLPSLLPPATGNSCRSVAGDVVFDGASTLYAMIGNAPTTTFGGNAFVVALDPGGALRWSRRYDGYWLWTGTLGLVGDEANNLYFRSGNDSISLGPDAAERFHLPNLSFVAAAVTHQVWDVTFSTGDGKMHYLFDAYDATTGKRSYELGPREIRAMPLVPPVFAAGTGYGFDSGMDYQPGESLVGFDATDGHVRWSAPLAYEGLGAAAADLLLTSRDSLLLAQGDFTQCDDSRCVYAAAHLREFSTAGAPRWTCEIPVEQVQSDLIGMSVSLALGGEVLAMAGTDGVVRGYSVQGAKPGSEGWIGARGSMQRTGRPIVH